MSDTAINEYYPDKKPDEVPAALVAGEAIASPSDTPSSPVSDATPEERKESLGITPTEVTDLGIDLPDIPLPDDQPIEESVKDAFDDVVRAKEDKARIINLADAYREDILPRARGNAAILTQAAEAYKQEQIAKAVGQTSRFLAVLEEYEKAPNVTKERLYLEAIEKILPETTIFVVGTGDGNLLQFLPLTNSNDLMSSEKVE